jgi:hypothetical protein
MDSGVASERQRMAPGASTGGDGAGNNPSWGSLLGVIASIAGVLAFAGITNYEDLSHKLFPRPSYSTITAPTTRPRLTTDPDAVRWAYVRAADAACGKVTSRAAKIPDVRQITYDWMKKHLDLRREMLKTWEAVQWPEATIGPVDSGKLSKIWADLDDANQSWAAMADDLRRKDRDNFNRHRDFFDTANASFVSGANAYGFSACNYGFASVGVYQ